MYHGSKIQSLTNNFLKIQIPVRNRVVKQKVLSEKMKKIKHHNNYTFFSNNTLGNFFVTKTYNITFIAENLLILG